VTDEEQMVVLLEDAYAALWHPATGDPPTAATADRAGLLRARIGDFLRKYRHAQKG
jgi:hypothetical protein